MLSHRWETMEPLLHDIQRRDVSLSEHDMQISVSTLRNNIVAVESASKLYTTLENLGVPRFVNARLQLPCITFPLTGVRRRPGGDGDKCFPYEVKADGADLLVTTEDNGAVYPRLCACVSRARQEVVKSTTLRQSPKDTEWLAQLRCYSAATRLLPPGSPTPTSLFNSILACKAYSADILAHPSMESV
ncbi:hypothetical protein DFJ58DRAFT_56109 [Suillus subalutaceus]|uniref:uncharacterized protein n=1 Tax=Suillus subalutaceus TaxID=48586 RepID=UPI001B869A00|nr:uncharacterized protein DFJ58DRAFT_56109 [Suillus subalutaceus]KAG1842375.1 hypothetical protein DFJ58DRAFT_56109 [Suillus subalutaceus]